MTEEEMRLACVEQAQRMTLPGESLADRVGILEQFVQNDPIRLGCLKASLDARRDPRITAVAVIAGAKEILDIVRPPRREKPSARTGGRRSRK